MMIAALLLSALFLPAVATDWVPIQVGDRWVYETQVLEGDNRHPEVEKWQEEITTVALRQLPDGLLIERRVRLLNDTSPARSAANWRSKANILVGNNCLYFLRMSKLGTLRLWPMSVFLCGKEPSGVIRSSIASIGLSLAQDISIRTMNLPALQQTRGG